VKTALLFLLCLSSASCRERVTRPPGLAIVDVTLVDVRDGTITPNVTVIVAGGRITAVGQSRATAVGARARRIDGRGKFLIPGLWDMHVRSDGDATVLNTMLSTGITGVRDMGGDSATLADARRDIDSRAVAGPQILFAAHGRSIERLEFLPASCRSRPAACDRRALDVVFEGLARNGTWLVPAIHSYYFSAPAQWTSIRSGFGDLVTLIRLHHVPILAGTDWSASLESLGAPAGWSLHAELAALVDAGFTSGEVLRAATLNPALFSGISDSLGAIDIGKTADLLLLDANPLEDIRNTRRVAAVISRGTLVAVP